MSDERFKIDTTSEIGHIYINNQDGEHMSWIEVENTLNEQQATIRRLQDLCGESDSENAKLRIENKRLQEENEQLKSARRDDAKEFSALFRQNFGLKRENEQLKKGGKE